MDKRLRSLSKTTIVFTCIAAVVLLALFPFDQKLDYQTTYASCALLCLIGIICPSYALDDKYGYCNPLTVVTIVYVMMFGVCPIYDIVNKEYLWFGYDLFDTGAYATVVAIVGYLVFVFVYAGSAKRGIRKRCKSTSIDLRGLRYTVPVICGMYAIAFAANAYYMVVAGGNSLLYSLSLGLIGEGGTASSDAALGAISMFSYCLPGVTLAYVAFGKSTPIKIVAVYLMLALQVSRGFRFIIFEIALMFLCFYRFKKSRWPKASILILAALVLLALVLFMTMFRNDVRGGSGVDFSAIDLTAITKSFDEMFWDNLRIYKNFYGMVAAIPSQVPFVYLQQIVWGTLTMFVPRAIWSGKPESMKAGPDLDVIIGPNLFNTGQAYPNIGEYWYAFGWLGVISFMAIYAWWMKRVSIKYGEPNNEVAMMLLSVLISVNLQLIIRGFTPSNFWFVIFSVLPLLALEPLCKLFETKRVRGQFSPLSTLQLGARRCS